MPEISKDWLEYEATHGGRFCLTGNAEEIIAQVQKLATAVGPPQPNTDPNLQIYDSSASSVPIRVYKPVNSENLPLCIFSHGGGFIAEDLDSEDGFCRWISKYTPCVVVSIDYRLGPKYKLPTMLEDVITAYDWVRDPSNRFVTEQTQIFAMGGSAGGALSLSLANHISEQRKAGNPVTRLAAVVALAPVILHPHHVVPEYLDVYKSYQENGTDVPIMDAAAMMTYFEAVNAVPNDSSIFAGLSPNLQDFPPTYIATCGADPLRDDGVVMAKMLEKAGVPIKHDHYPGLPHIFWIFPDFALSRVFAENLMMGIKFVLTKK